MASVTYRINGEFDSKPLSTAQNAMKKLGQVASGLKTALAGIAVAKLAEGFHKLMDGAEEAFTAQNKALVSFRKAAANNLKLTAEDVDALTEKMGELSANNFFDGDSLNYAAEYLANVKLSRQQIEKTLDAATELAAAGVMPLNDAAKSLAKTFSGELEGALTDIAPDLKNLTEEQIRNGKVVDLLKDKYSGFRDTIAGTFSGRDTQFQNTFGDLQASIGGITKALKFEGQGEIMPQLQKITDWITQNRNYIINFFLQLPKVAEMSLGLMGEYFFNFLEPENMIQLVKNVINIWVKGFQNAANLIPEIIKTEFTLLSELGGIYGGKIGLAFVKPFAQLFIDGINKVMEGFENSVFGTAFKWVYEKLSGKSADNLFGAINTSLDILERGLKDEAAVERAQKKADEAAKKQIETQMNKTFDKLGDVFKGDIEARKKLFKDMNAANKESNEEFAKKLKELLGQDLPDDLKKALEAQVKATTSGATATSTSTSTSTSTDTGTKEEKKEAIKGAASAIEPFTSALSGLGSTLEAIAMVVQAITSGNWIGFIISLIVKLVQAIAENSSIVQGFLDGFTDTIGVFAKKIAPSLGKIIEPLLSLFPALGVILDVIATILKALTPLLTLVAKAFGLVFKVIGYIIGSIANAIIALVRGVINILNKIPFVNISKPDYIDITGSDYEIDTSGTTDDSTTSSDITTSSASASYTAARDIYMNVYYNNSYINGDARAIALSIREEIRRAEQLGY